MGWYRSAGAGNGGAGAGAEGDTASSLRRQLMEFTELQISFWECILEGERLRSVLEGSPKLGFRVRSNLVSAHQERCLLLRSVGRLDDAELHQGET